MKTFEEKKFNIPKLKGISEKTIEEHLKLYAGYVKHANMILEKVPEYEEYARENPDNGYALTLLQRRFAFEFDGIRNHEIYFSHFENGPQGDASVIPGFNLERFKALALTRGIGWAILYYDPASKQLLNQWVDEQHFGHLTGCTPILALDMWEHSFVADYQPSGKKQYVEDFFANLNWNTVEENFKKAQ